jgi:hypothetical protein
MLVMYLKCKTISTHYSGDKDVELGRYKHISTQYRHSTNWCHIKICTLVYVLSLDNPNSFLAMHNKTDS